MPLTGFFTLEHTAKVLMQPATGVGGGSITFGAQMRSKQGGGFGFGVGAGRFNRRYYYNSRHTGNTALLTTSARALDLQTQVDEFNVALGLEEVVYLDFVSDPENTQNITWTPNASNGWTSLLGAAGDLLNIKPGCRVTFNAMHLDVGWAVGTTNKVLDIANAVSSTQHYELLIVGRSTS